MNTIKQVKTGTLQGASYIDEAYPENGKLIIGDEGEAHSLIVDEELDPIECIFNNDNCVQLNTEGYGYITLSVDNLNQLIKLINKAEKHYSK